MRTRRRLGDMLRERRLVDELQLRSALGFHNRFGVPLGQVVVDMGFCAAHQVLAVLAEQVGLSTVDLDAELLDPALVERVPLRVAEAHRVVPLRVEGLRTLWVATVAPADPKTLDTVASVTGHSRVVPLLATDGAVRRGLERLYYPHLLGAQRPVEPIELPEADEHLPLEHDRGVYLQQGGSFTPQPVGKAAGAEVVEQEALPLMVPLEEGAGHERRTQVEVEAVVERRAEPEVLVYGWGAEATADLVRLLGAEGLRVQVASTQEMLLADGRKVVLAPLQSMGAAERRGVRARLVVAGRLPEVDLPRAQALGAQAFIGSPLDPRALVAEVHHQVREARVPVREVG